MMDAIEQKQQNNLLEVKNNEKTSEASQKYDEERANKECDDSKCEIIETFNKTYINDSIMQNTMHNLTDNQSVSKEIVKRSLNREVGKDDYSNDQNDDIINQFVNEDDNELDFTEVVNINKAQSTESKDEAYQDERKLTIEPKISSVGNHSNEETSKKSYCDFETEKKHQINQETSSEINSSQRKIWNPYACDLIKNGEDSNHSSSNESITSQRIENEIHNNIKEESRDQQNKREYPLLTTGVRQFPQTVVHSALWKCKEEYSDDNNIKEVLTMPTHKKCANSFNSINEEKMKLNGESCEQHLSDRNADITDTIENADLNGTEPLASEPAPGEEEGTSIEEKQCEFEENENLFSNKNCSETKDISNSSTQCDYGKDFTHQEDDASRSSTSSSSTTYSSASSSASSRNLVIDHSFEELDMADQPINKEATHRDEISIPKRKRSLDQEINSPKHKYPYLETNAVDETHNIVGTSGSIIALMEEEKPPLEQSTPSVENKKITSLNPKYISSIQNERLPACSSNKKSKLKSPQETFMNPFNELIKNPAERLLIGQNVIKYDCFKCKTVSFNTFMELREHQRNCVYAQKNYPTSSSSIQDTPSISPERQSSTIIQSVKNSLAPQKTQEMKRVYMCSACGTYHENWNLFLHIREIHNRHICLYCVRLFPTAEKLSLHLEIKHDLEQIHFNSEDALRSSSGGCTRFLMCCTCQHVFSEHERFSDHICTEYVKPCSLCGLKGRHSNQCKANPEKQPKVKKKPKQMLLETRIANLPASSTVSSAVQLTIPEKSKNVRNKTSSMNLFNSLYATQQQQQQQAVPSPLASPGDYNSKEITTFPNPDNSLKINGCYQVPTETQLRLSSVIAASSNRLLSNPSPVPLPPPPPPPLSTKLPTTSNQRNVYSDDSDSSSNMVIDESCTNTYGNDGSSKNLIPFKNIDSQQFNLEGQQMGETENSTQFSVNTLGRLEEPKPIPLIVPKFKLRVPKEFQKSVESEISSTETDCEDEENDESNLKNDAPILANRLQNGVSGIAKSMEPIAEGQYNESFQSEHQSQSPPQMNEDNSADESNPNLVRILAEIERTKLDIKRTKETLRGTAPINKDKPQKLCYYSPDNKNTPLTSPETDWNSPSNEVNNDECQTKSINQIEQPQFEQKIENSSETTNGAVEENRSEPLEKAAIDEVELEEAVDPNVGQQQQKSPSPAPSPPPPADGIEVADEDVPLVDLMLDRPLEKFEIVEFIRICLKAVFPYCLYCNHARRIAVNGHSLVLHLLAQHRFAATVDSITAEELLPSTIVSKLKSFLPSLTDHFFNSNSYCTMGDGKFIEPFNERIFECFQCRFVTATHKELYLHNRKMHLKTAILCFMCRANFFSFSEILCHICPGAPNKTPIFDVKFRCCLCDADKIPSPFRLMVHLRKIHFACDVCLEDCQDQGRLSSHVWKHKLHHLCYRCGIAYRNKMDITKHLFWKHGTESIICKRCLQKRWRHVYHFCIPPITFICDVCNLSFSRATFLKVHKRIHTGDIPYPCTEDNCDRKFVSRRLLMKHSLEHNPVTITPSRSPHSASLTELNAENDQKEGNLKNNISKKDNEEPIIVKEDSSFVKKEKSNETDANVDNITEEMKKPIEATNKNNSSTVVRDTPRKKKKRHRNKESLEDLNLIAPNLSESDSSDGSDLSENKSRNGESESLVPKVILSPPSEAEMDVDNEKESNSTESGKILDIWKNFKSFQAAQRDGTQISDDENVEKILPAPILHVASSDHDYCAIFKVRTETTKVISSDKTINKSISPTKKKQQKTPRNKMASGSSSSDSSSGSDTSCSCGSNCSCSSSDSSGSSSSSSDDSDSSTSEGRRRIANKKTKKQNERQHKKSESSTKNSSSDHIVVVDDDKNIATATENYASLLQTKNEALFHESDLDTAESETDEEFYDEHPQKLASELLAQKRLQLMAQTRLSPSHNYDIVENSRPSTPSLPEEIAKEKKIKLKKKKKDRKSSSKNVKMNLSVNEFPAPVQQHQLSAIMHHHSMQVPEIDLIPPYDLIASPGVAEPPTAQQPLPLPLPPPPSIHHHQNPPTTIYNNINIHQIAQKPMPSSLLLTAKPLQSHSRLSEGSSCSDADGSLKRSKRARRPNKFYGYTSDEESMGNPLIIGMRAFKPQPPPQLTWCKEDLPAPSKSILLNKNKIHRNPKPAKDGSGTGIIPFSENNIDPTGLTIGLNNTGKKRRAHTKDDPSGFTKPRKRRNLPPIPTLKIRPQPPPNPNNVMNTSQLYTSSKESDDTSESSSDDDDSVEQIQTQPTTNMWNNCIQTIVANNTFVESQPPPIMMQQYTPVMTTQPPPQPPPSMTSILPTSAPAPPMAVAFNHKIPPALLPNPDFATLQYFKRNNIRYPIRPPAGARQAREGESVYCYCRCPYDEVSEMIACDGENCLIEWFHFECVGIMVAPQGKWFCAECRPQYSNELYPTM